MYPPKAKKISHTIEIHGDKRLDHYFWLKNKEDQEVFKYLQEENNYCDFIMRDAENLKKELFEEMKARYKENEESLPYFFNKYWYTIRYEAGKEYPIFTRKYKTLENNEIVLLDTNILARNHAFFEVGSISVSPDNKLMCFSIDTLGKMIYTLKFKNLETDSFIKDEIQNTSGDSVWSNDGKYIFYTKKDKNLRTFQVYRHKIGTKPKDDVLVFHEKDETFDLHIFKTKSLKYIFIVSSNTISSENRYISADNVMGEWKIIEPRRRNLEYSVEHYEEFFYIITNADEAKNFKLVRTKVEQCKQKYWQEVIPHHKEILLENFEIFKNYLVLEERNKGLLQIKIINHKTKEFHYLPFQESTYTAYIGVNLDFDTEILRYSYTSLIQPYTVSEYNMKDKTSKILKKQEVLGGDFIMEDYISERIWVPSRDGKNKIPVSLVHHKNTTKSKNTPLLLHGYGSYGCTTDATFSNIRLSLLNRGFIYAIAHVRGGEYLGREWYEDGKILKKKNTFYDFIDVAQFLISEKYTSSQHLYAVGGSAGGLLMGTVSNIAPNLFNGIIAQVPFVDVVTTMMDEEIPLTTGEYHEWGNPHDKEYYEYMKSYSPYDNVKAQNYPNMLITTGLQDSQVPYWESAKWVAKLRELKTDNNILLLKTDMNSGHSGASGRFESLKEDALEYAFLLKLESEQKTE